MISLIVATLHRTAELERLLASLDTQSFQDFEVIVVDQNSDQRLLELLGSHPSLKLSHLRCAPGASRARNIGIRAAQGGIIGFPDDDCWYSKDLLQTVSNWFASHPEGDGLVGILRDETGRPTGPKWPQKACVATQETLWNSGITPVVFLARRAIEGAGFFDERIGPGTAAGYYSGEDLDYFLRCVERGLRLWHDPDLAVSHPSFHRPERMRDTSYSYSLGGGYILRSHRYPVRKFMVTLIRSFGGAVVYFVKGDFFLGRCYLRRATGLSRGYFCGPGDLQKAYPSAAGRPQAC
jgi:glycosyltransferase involved in cell wall biosynthesis